MLYGSRLDQVGKKHQVSSNRITYHLDSQLPTHRPCRLAYVPPARRRQMRGAPSRGFRAVAHADCTNETKHDARLKCKLRRDLEELCVHRYQQGNGTDPVSSRIQVECPYGASCVRRESHLHGMGSLVRPRSRPAAGKPGARKGDFVYAGIDDRLGTRSSGPDAYP